MYRKEKRIPTLFALFLIFAVIGLSVYIDRNQTSVLLQANQLSQPLEVHFTNISESSFTISWLTEKSVPGVVEIVQNKLNKIYFDVADKDNIPKARQNHYIQVDGLNENTDYEVRIRAGKNCPNSVICPVYKQKTSIKLETTLNLSPVRGAINDENTSPLENAIVYVSVGKNAPLSGRTDKAGLYVIPLNNLRSQDLLQRPVLNDSDIVQINVNQSVTQKITSVVDIKSIRQNLTIPVMTIGNSYNFIDLMGKKDLLAKSANTSILGTQTDNINLEEDSFVTDSSSITILFPKKDDDTTPDSRPRIRGLAPPGSKLLIIVKSSPQIDQVISAKDGTWSWRPAKPLEPGTHYVSIQGYDNQGNLITQTKKFIVLKSGEQVLGESTPSASLTPAPTDIVSPTAVFSPTMGIISPTVPGQLTATPKIELSPTIFYPSATPLISDTPRTGTASPTYIIIGTSIVLLLVGLKFLIL